MITRVFRHIDGDDEWVVIGEFHDINQDDVFALAIECIVSEVAGSYSIMYDERWEEIADKVHGLPAGEMVRFDDLDQTWFYAVSR